MTTYSKRLAIASTNAFARDAPRSNRAGELHSPRRSRINLIELFVTIRGVSGRLNLPLIPNVSRSRQPTRLQETHQGATERGNWILFVVHALIELFVTIRGVSGRLNNHLFQTSRDRVNQRVCKRHTKEQQKLYSNSPRIIEINSGVGGHSNSLSFLTSHDHDRVNQRVYKGTFNIINRLGGGSVNS